MTLLAVIIIISAFLVALVEITSVRSFNNFGILGTFLIISAVILSFIKLPLYGAVIILFLGVTVQIFLLHLFFKVKTYRKYISNFTAKS